LIQELRCVRTVKRIIKKMRTIVGNAEPIGLNIHRKMISGGAASRKEMIRDANFRSTKV
jgi:hypothetical protein